MTIQQFNGSYLIHDDRVLFRIKTVKHEEYRFWFTRRVTLFILAASAHLHAKKLEQNHSPDTAKAINEFEKQTILEVAKNENSAQAYEGGLIFPLGFEPILVMDVFCSLTKNGEKLAKIDHALEGPIDDTLSMDFVLPGGSNLNLKLAGNAVQAMSILLDQFRIQAGWGEAVLQVNTAPTEEKSINTASSKNISVH